MEFFKVTNIDFIGFRKKFAIFSIVLSILGILAITILKPELGIDFKGGTEIGVQIDSSPDISNLRDVISKEGIKGSEIKSYGKNNQYLIRIVESDISSENLKNILMEKYPDTKVEILKVDKIGPKISGELLIDALWALIIATIAILIYIAFRFDFNFGLGAVVAMVHDLLLTFTMIVVTHHLGLVDLEMNQGLMAGLLTVIGYSINDTVVIFDRVRENLEKHKGMKFNKIVNLSLNETLSRTINTGMSVLLVLIVIFVFGGPVLQGLVFTMFWGLVFGTYSSVYVASNFVIWRNEKKDTNDAEQQKSGKKFVTAKI